MIESPPGPAGGAGAATRARILEAAIRCLVREGVAGASMSAIAATGEVSKALLHYHFADRTRLLTEVMAQLTYRTIAREGAALERAAGSGAVDALWKWLDEELARGELRALLELGMYPDEQLRVVADATLVQRRRAATRTAEVLFGALGLTPRIPATLLGAASVTFIDGLVVGNAPRHDDARVSFDVFWLALLGLVT